MGRAFEFRKERKMKRWSNMAKTFTKIGKEIAMAVKQGGADPATNSKLRAVIQNARSVNMPKDNIERAIKKASSKEQEDYKEMVYEGYAPHGIAVVVECTTDNPNRTVANVRSAFNKCGGSLGTSGMLDFMFDRKSVFKIAVPQDFDAETFELDMIDFGAEEIFESEDGLLVIHGDFSDFGRLQKALEEKGLEIREANFERLPKDTKELSPEQVAEVEKLLEKLEDDDDVQNVYHNMA